MTPSKIAWVTGASSGLGEATAQALGQRGWRVAISARRTDLLTALAARSGGALVPFPLDVTDPVATQETVAAIESRLGPLDLALLNAGTHIPMGAADFDPEILRHLWEVNVMGAAHGLQALLPRMMQRRRGILGVVASAAGYCGLPSAAAYAPSKAALIAMAESLRPEAVAAGVDLKLINPGFIKTPLTDKNTFPMPFLMAADKAADQLVDSFLRPGFEVTFPKRLAWSMKVLRFLPYPLFFAITRRMGGF